MRQIILTLYCLLLLAPLQACNDSDLDHWTKMDSLIYRNPAKAITEIAAIKKNAAAKNNIPEQLRCIFTELGINDMQNEPVFKQKLDEMHLLQQQCHNKADLAVVQILEAKALWDYYNIHNLAFKGRRDTSPSKAIRFEEWTRRMLKNEVKRLHQSALTQEGTLTTPATNYSLLINPHADSRKFRPSIFDAMAYSLLQHNIYSPDERLDLMANIVEAHKNDDDKHAYIMALLHEAKLKHDLEKLTTTQYLTLLDSLLNQFAESPLSQLVRIRKAFDMQLFMFNVLKEDLNITVDDITNLCNEGIDRFPDNEYTEYLRNIVSNLHRKAYDLTLPSYFFRTSDSIKLQLKYANTRNLNVTISRFTCSNELFPITDTDSITFLPKEHVADYTFTLPSADFRTEKDTLFTLPPLPYGDYELTADNKQIFFTVTDFLLLSTNYQYNRETAILTVVDSKTGAPVSDATIASQPGCTHYANSLEYSTTNKNGAAHLNWDLNYRHLCYQLYVSKGDDKNWQFSVFNEGKTLHELNPVDRLMFSNYEEDGADSPLKVKNGGRFFVEPGQRKEVRISTPLSNAHLLVIETSRKNELRRRWIPLNKKSVTLSFALDSTDGRYNHHHRPDDVKTVSFVLVHNGEVYNAYLQLVKKNKTGYKQEKDFFIPRCNQLKPSGQRLTYIDAPICKPFACDFDQWRKYEFTFFNEYNEDIDEFEEYTDEVVPM